MAENTTNTNSTMNVYLEQFLIFVATNPKDFLFYVFLLLTPLMMICGFLSLKLAYHIEKRDKDKKKKATRQSNMVRTKRKVKTK